MGENNRMKGGVQSQCEYTKLKVEIIEIIRRRKETNNWNWWQEESIQKRNINLIKKGK